MEKRTDSDATWVGTNFWRFGSEVYQAYKEHGA